MQSEKLDTTLACIYIMSANPNLPCEWVMYLYHVS